VLGNGINIVFPPENAELFERITAHGAVLTQFPFNRKADKQSFPIRNRIVAGMTMGTVVVEAAEDLGGSVDASADVEYAEIRGSALAVHGAALLELIADVALEPTFPAPEVERERKLIASQIQTRAETPFALAMDTLLAEMYGSHPYGLPALGQKPSVERLGREDLVEHYRRVYRGGGTVLAISGGVERETVRRQVERLFATLASGQPGEGARPAVPPATGTRRVLDRPVQQAQLLMGFLGPGIGEADYAPGKVMTAILGGGMAGRLFAVLRDQQGLAYSLGMLNPSRRGPGYFVSYLGTAGDTVETAETGMRQELERFRSDGPSDAELARAKALKPEAVRQTCKRLVDRVSNLAATDPYFAPLADLPLLRKAS